MHGGENQFLNHQAYLSVTSPAFNLFIVRDEADGQRNPQERRFSLDAN